MYPLLSLLLKANRILGGRKIEIVDDKREKTKRPIIYTVCHIGKFDIEIVLEAINDHCYLLEGDPEYMYRTFDGYFLEINGVIYVDTSSKSDKHIAKETAIRILKQGANVLWFPEGIWNLSPNQIILPCPFGIIEAALRSNEVIVPIGIEQYDNRFYINIGGNFPVEKYTLEYSDELKLRKAAMDDLRDALATLKFEIWEHFPVLRKDINNEYYDKFIQSRIDEWPFFTRQAIETRVYKPKALQLMTKRLHI